MDKQNPEFYMEPHCIIHEQSVCGKHVMKAMVSETDAEYEDVLCHNRTPMIELWDRVKNFFSFEA
jgi:hypothetical protein